MDDSKKRESCLVADRSGRAGLSVGLGPLACWDCGFESRLGHRFLSYEYCVLSEVSTTDRSPVQRSPTECGTSECDRGTSERRPRPTRAVEP